MSNLRNLTKNRIQDNNIGKNIDHASPCRKTHDEIPKTRKKPSISVFLRLSIINSGKPSPLRQIQELNNASMMMAMPEQKQKLQLGDLATTLIIAEFGQI